MFDIHARQSRLFTVELANDNVDPKRHTTGALDLEGLREVFHSCGLDGFAAVALLTDQRDILTEIGIDGMHLHRSTFHTAGVRALRVLLELAAAIARRLRLSCVSGSCTALKVGVSEKNSLYLSVAQRTTLSEEGLQRRVWLQQRVQASAYSDHVIRVTGEPGMHPRWAIKEG
jgi:hypothetical protein